MMFKVLVTTAVAITALVPMAAAIAQPAPPIPLEHFARLPQSTDLRLSPDGTRFAAIFNPGDRLNAGAQKFILIMSRDGDSSANQSVDLGTYTPRSIEWADNSYVVVSVAFPYQRNGIKTTETRLLSINADNGKMKNLVSYKGSNISYDTNQFSQVQDDIISLRQQDKRTLLLALDENRPLQPSVFSVDPKNGKRDKELGHRNNIQKWFADASGEVRAGHGRVFERLTHVTRDNRVVYKGSQDSKLETISMRHEDDPEYFFPMGLSEDADVMLISKRNEHNRWALYWFNVPLNEIVGTVFSHDKYDHGSVSYIENTDRLASYNYIADQLVTVPYDAKIRADYATIARLLPGQSTHIEGTVQGTDIVIAQGDASNVPTGHYLIDLKAGTVGLLGDSYPELRAAPLAETTAISFTARDGLPLTGYVTVPQTKPATPLSLGRPMVLLTRDLHRDRADAGFDPMVQYFVSRGWSVLQLNTRGTKGFGQEFEDAGNHELGLGIQNDHVDGVKWAIANNIADPARICIIGHGMGATTAMLGLAKTPELFKCAVGLNGMYDIQDVLERWSGYYEFSWWQDQLDYDQLDAVSPVKQAGNINAPVLIAYGEEDRRMDQRQSKKMIASLQKAGKAVTALELKDGDHFLGKSANRLAFYQALDAFLQKHLGGTPAIE